MAKRKKKKKSLGKSIFSIILMLISLYFILSVMVLNILDIIHLLVMIGGIVFIDLLFLLFRKKFKLFGSFLVIGLCILLLVFSFNVNKVASFLNNLDLNYKTYHYSVVVLKSSDKKKLSDIRNLSLGYYDDGSKESDKSLDKIRKKQETDVVAYEDTHKLANDLIQGKVEAILLEDTYLDILDESIEQDGVSFKNLIRKIYEFVIITKTSDFSHDIDVTKEPFNIYISGIDTYGEISSVSRSDVNMIVSVNPTTKQILLTSVPRDYYVSLHGKKGYKDKLTHAGLYGVDMSIQTLEDLLDIKINYYVKVNFSSVVKIVDAIDGVKVYSDYEFTSIDGIHYDKGYNKLNGEEALGFARERKSFPAGDRQRIKNQQVLFEAILDKIFSKSIITKYNKLFASIQGSFVTNMKTSRIMALARLQLSKKYKWNISVNSLAGEDGKNYTYSSPSVQSYVMVPVTSSVEEAHSLIQDIFGGKIQKSPGGTTSNNSSSSNNNATSSVVQKETSSNDNKESGFEVSLIKDRVSFDEGDTYVYHGYRANCQGKVVTTSDGLKEEFKVNNKSFDNYKELVSYVSGLPAGNYVINYILEYHEEVVNLKQYVEINKFKSDSIEEVREEDSSLNEDEESSGNSEDTSLEED